MSLLTLQSVEKYAYDRLGDRASSALHKARNEVLHKLCDAVLKGHNERSTAVVLSSDGNNMYKVSYQLEEGPKCTCPAGKHSPVCKHGLALLMLRANKLPRHADGDVVQPLSSPTPPPPSVVDLNTSSGIQLPKPTSRILPSSKKLVVSNSAEKPKAATRKKQRTVAPSSDNQQERRMMTGEEMLAVDDDVLLAECRAVLGGLNKQKDTSNKHIIDSSTEKGIIDAMEDVQPQQPPQQQQVIPSISEYMRTIAEQQIIPPAVQLPTTVSNGVLDTDINVQQEAVVVQHPTAVAQPPPQQQQQQQPGTAAAPSTFAQLFGWD